MQTLSMQIFHSHLMNIQLLKVEMIVVEGIAFFQQYLRWLLIKVLNKLNQTFEIQPNK